MASVSRVYFDKLDGKSRVADRGQEGLSKPASQGQHFASETSVAVAEDPGCLSMSDEASNPDSN